MLSSNLLKPKDFSDGVRIAVRDAVKFPGHRFLEATEVTKNVSGLMNALRQFINEAILESDDVAAAMAALKRTGKCPVFTVDITLQDVSPTAAEPAEAAVPADQLQLSESDVEFLAAIGITEPGSPRYRHLK